VLPTTQTAFLEDERRPSSTRDYTFVNRIKKELMSKDKKAILKPNAFDEDYVQPKDLK
jgi:hypothetical protein